EQFGTNDKLALLVGIGVFLAVYAMVIGAVAFRRTIVIGVVGIGVFGLIGAYAAFTRRVGGSFGETVPSVVGATVGAAALWFSHRTLRPILPSTAVSSTSAANQAGAAEDPDTGTRTDPLISSEPSPG